MRTTRLNSLTCLSTLASRTSVPEELPVCPAQVVKVGLRQFMSLCLEVEVCRTRACNRHRACMGRMTPAIHQDAARRAGLAHEPAGEPVRVPHCMHDDPHSSLAIDGDWVAGYDSHPLSKSWHALSLSAERMLASMMTDQQNAALYTRIMIERYARFTPPGLLRA